MCHQNDTANVAGLIEAAAGHDYISNHPKATGRRDNQRRSKKMQAVVTTRPRSFRALLIVLALGAAMIVTLIGGYFAGSANHPSSVTSTSVTQSSSGQSGPGLHGRYGGFQ
jgi:hypothetical protein